MADHLAVYDPSPAPFVLACGDPPETFGVRGDVVGCFMARQLDVSSIIPRDSPHAGATPCAEILIDERTTRALAHGRGQLAGMVTSADPGGDPV